MCTTGPFCFFDTSCTIGFRPFDTAWRIPVTTPPGQRVSYIRVSSTDQNPARQREAVGRVDREFLDMISGRSTSGRTGLAEALTYLRAGDELVVASIDRLARSLYDLRQIVDKVVERGATVHFVKEHMRFSPEAVDPRDTLMFSMLGAFAEFERALIRERQADGIAVAKAKGKYRGAPRAMTAEMVTEARRRIAAGETKAAIARDMGVGRQTLYRYLRA